MNENLENAINCIRYIDQNYVFRHGDKDCLKTAINFIMEYWEEEEKKGNEHG